MPQEFDAYLERLVNRPYERAEIEREIEELFSQDCAVMVLDMAGFSSVTRAHGVVPFLLMIHQLRMLAVPIVREVGGTVVEAKADDLLCIFPSVADGVAAGRRIFSTLDDVNVVLPGAFKLYASIGLGWGRILRLSADRVAGDQVNLAAKLGEDVADHGEILLTEAAFRQLGEVAAHQRRTGNPTLEFDYYALAD